MRGATAQCSWPFSFAVNPRKTIRQYQSRYYLYCAATMSRQRAVREDRLVEEFVAYYWPEKRYPEDFVRLDVEDFRVLQVRAGHTASRINSQCGAIRRFWEWLAEAQGLPVPSLVVKPLAHARQKVKSRPLKDLGRLWTELYDPQLRDAVRRILTLGEPAPKAAAEVGLSRHQLRRRFKCARDRAGLDVTLATLRPAFREALAEFALQQLQNIAAPVATAPPADPALSPGQ